MKNKIQLLDCTLRDGAYVVDAKFGAPAIKGIIKKMQDANIDIIECGWLKNSEYEEGTTFFHMPADLEQYIVEKSLNATYVAMIDWDRYDLEQLPKCDGKTIDAIRIVFPHNKYREGIALGRIVKEKGYDVFFQAANTLAYSEEELVDLAKKTNEIQPIALSVVDTFGAMYSEDLLRIVKILDANLCPEIALGFHSHNNQQLSFALSTQFVEMLQKSERRCIVDSSLCGMGRGAGNATTELVANFLNKKCQANYDMNIIMDAIDMYMQYFMEHYEWGYSIPYFIAGMYCAHVNNISYLLTNHRTNAKDMRNIIESLSEEDRKKYDYELLEEIYLDYQNKIVDDELGLTALKKAINKRNVLLLLPGKSIVKEEEKIKEYIQKYNPIVIGVNAIFDAYKYDYIFFSNVVRYNYAKEIYADNINTYNKIIASNIKTVPDENELIVNYNMLIKRGWDHFDNSGMMCLRLLNKLHVSEVALAGFDGFGNIHADNYADETLPHINPGKAWEELNDEISDMLKDFRNSTNKYMKIEFVTKSKYE